jgi:hypothetical protein
MDTEQLERLARKQATVEEAVRQGKAWVQKLASELGGLPKGTVVVINCATGEYVTADSRLAGLRMFQDRFGDIPGYLYEIGGGLFIGGGIA